MDYFTKIIELKTTEKIDFIDVTKKVKKIVKESGIVNGIVSLFSTHTTCSIRINENESGLMEDLKRFLEKIAPSHLKYFHDDIEKRNCPEDEQINAHSHIKSILLGTSETIPLINSELSLGKWQSIFFIDLDGPRQRKMIVHIVGK